MILFSFLIIQILLKFVHSWTKNMFTCQRILHDNGQLDIPTPSGVYNITLEVSGGEVTFPTYCNMDLNVFGGGFMLIESYSYGERGRFGDKPFHTDYEVNENDFHAEGFNAFALSLQKRNWIVEGLNNMINGKNENVGVENAMVLITCNNDFSEYYYSRIDVSQILGSTSNNWNIQFERARVRPAHYPNAIVDGSAAIWNTDTKWHISGDWPYPWSNGMKSSEDNFGFYSIQNIEHKCMAGPDSTTNYYFVERGSKRVMGPLYWHEPKGWHCIYTSTTSCDCSWTFKKNGDYCDACNDKYNYDPQGTHCNVTICDGKLSLEEGVCNGHGKCKFWEACTCDYSEYTGSYCENWNCSMVSRHSVDACNSHGTCVAYNECECNAGYFENGPAMCEQCGTGEISATGDNVCQTCPAGEYTSDHITCQCCDAGHHPNGAQDGCEKCAPGDVAPLTCDLCTACPPGSTANAAGTTCTVCPDGNYEVGRTACLVCPAGSFCVDGLRYDCADGKYSSVGESVCTSCAAGERETNNTCVACDEGMISGEASIVCTMCSNATFASVDHKQCLLCTQGYYCNGTDGLRHPCEEGEVATSQGLEECVPCPAGTYENNRVECLPCDAGWVSPEGSGECFLTCENGTYADVDLCRPCPPGHYCYFGQKHPCLTGYVSNGTIPCEACPAGTREEGRVDCIECNDGQTSGEASELCFICPEGFYDEDNLHLSCASCEVGNYCTGGLMYECDPGKYTDAPGQTLCQQCLPGTFEVNRTTCDPCPDGSIAPTSGLDVCSVCIDGEFASADHLECKDCNAGFYCVNGFEYPCTDGWWSGARQDHCLICPKGSFEVAHTSCSNCSDGKIAPNEGSSKCDKCNSTTYADNDRDECLVCDAGYYCDGTDGKRRPCDPGHISLDGAETCDICPAGTFEVGLTSCTPCDAGEISGEGASSCTVCNPGEYANANHTLCLECEAGSFCVGGEKSPCAGGTISDVGASVCDSCLAGTMENNNVECLDCADGYIAAVGGATECEICAPGTFASLDNVECNDCIAGSYCVDGLRYDCADGLTSGALATICTECPAGTKEEGNTVCAPCEAGRISAAGSITCTKCSATSYASLDHTACTLCEPGFYCDGSDGTKRECVAGSTSSIGADTCTFCPRGTYELTHTACVPCDAGKYSLEGSIECTVCIDGTISNLTHCNDCTPGFFCTNGLPTECAAGYYSGFGASECDPCGAGTYEFNHVECLECPDGKFSVGGTATCDFCPITTYEDGSNIFCLQCDAGYYCDGTDGLRHPCGPTEVAPTGSSSCTECGDTLYVNNDNSACLTCNAGYYCVNGSRFECPDNHVQPLPAQTSCTECTGGLFPNADRTICHGCPANQIFTTVCENCTEGEYANNTLTCEDCIPGYYCTDGYRYPCGEGRWSGIRETSCSICGVGGYAALDHASCTPCDSGYYCDGTDGLKHPCLDGETSGVGEGSCSPCSPGFYADALHQNCLVCEAGSYCQNGIMLPCADGSMSGAGADNCTICGPTLVATDSHLVCDPCTAAYYCPGDGFMYECNDGEYSNAAAASCTVCGPGTYGEVSHLSCSACEAGKYCPGDGFFYPCDSGTVSAAGQDVCTDCLAGTYQAMGNKTDCLPCLPGWISTDKATACTICNEGDWSDGGSQCLLCPEGSKCTGGIKTECQVGWITSSPGQTQCSECGSGYYQNNNHTFCEFCPEGHVSIAGVDTCTMCLIGTYEVGLRTFCQQCSIGYYCDGTDGLRHECSDGYFTDSLAQSSCSMCLAGTHEVSHSQCVVCDDGQISGDAAHSCEACNATTYEDGTHENCLVCEASYYCPGDGIRYECSPGYISTDSADVCSMCLAGTYEVNHLSCVPCLNGSISTDASDTCSVCGEGLYDVGSSSCEPCLAGFYCSGGIIRECAPGRISEAGKSVCSECVSGTYEKDHLTCEDCLEGHVAETAGLDECTKCPIGRYESTHTDCLLCSIGFYCDGTDGLRHECSDGYYTDSLGAGACIECGAGTFEVTHSRCDVCGTGEVSSAGSSLCTRCSVTTYANGNHTECLVCEASYFCDGDGERHPCQTGYISSEGQSVCQICPAGTYELDNLSCEPCAIGSVSSEGSGSCSYCAEGLYEVTSQTCEPCLAGNYCTGGIMEECESGTISLSGKPFCTECLPGEYESNHLTCEPCSDGEVSGVKSDTCVVCEEGKYEESNEICLDCQAGKYCSGGISTLCPTGQISEAAQSQCDICPAGTFENEHLRCSPCPVGHVSLTEGLPMCIKCWPQSYANHNSTACNTCTPGYYCDGVDGVRIECPEGSISAISAVSCTECGIGEKEVGRVSCDSCPDGWIAPNTGSATCTQCLITTYSSPTRDECLLCRRGYYCPQGGIMYPCEEGFVSTSEQNPSGEGAALCEICPGGFFSNINATECVECPIGHYCVNGKTIVCEDGSIAPEKAAVRCDECPGGTTSNSGKTDCVPCPIGMISDDGSMYCRDCAAGFYANDAADDCYHCPANHYCQNGLEYMCDPGTVSPGGIILACQPCVGGSYAPTNSTECLQCPAGHYCGERCTDPVECNAGFWCPAGSSFQTPCQCSGKGDCNATAGDCLCWEGFTGESCAQWMCYGYANTDPAVCTNLQGMCLDVDDCQCTTGHRGDKCQIFSCFGIWIDTDDGSEKVELCSNHGECVSKDVCNCTKQWDGTRCDEKVKVNTKTETDSRKTTIAITSAVLGVVVLLCLLLFVVGVPVACCVVKMKKNLKDYKKYDKELELIKLDSTPGDDTPGDSKSLAKFNMSKKFFEIGAKDLKLTEKIGEGGYAEVFKCDWDGKEVALKLFAGKQLTSDKDFKDFERELEIISSISHPNVMSFFGCMRRPPRLGIVIEYCENGDLQTYIEDHPNDLSFDKKIELLRGVASAIIYLHKRTIIHRDLKSANVLLTKGLEPKLCDFGLSKCVAEKGGVFTRLVGTNFYMAPEIVVGSDYCVKADVFSFAMMLFEVALENFQPYGIDLKFNVEVRVATQPEFRPKYSMDDFSKCLWYCQMMEKAWQADVDERPSMQEIHEALKQRKFPPEMPKDFQQEATQKKKISVHEMMKVQMMCEDKKTGDLVCGDNLEKVEQQETLVSIPDDSKKVPKRKKAPPPKPRLLPGKDEFRPLSYRGVNQQKTPRHIEMEIEMEPEMSASENIMDVLSSFD